VPGTTVNHGCRRIFRRKILITHATYTGSAMSFLRSPPAGRHPRQRCAVGYYLRATSWPPGGGDFRGEVPFLRFDFPPESMRTTPLPSPSRRSCPRPSLSAWATDLSAGSLSKALLEQATFL